MTKSPTNQPSVRFRITYLAPFFLLLLLTCTTIAQESTSEPSLSDFELLMKGEADLKLAVSNYPGRQNFALSAHKRLQSILQRDPNTPFRFQIPEDLRPLQEILGKQNLAIAKFYMNSRNGHSLHGAESRLTQVALEYPGFSGMDEILLLLGECAVRAERPNDAAQYLWKLVCSYPDSNLSESAFRRLNQIGSSQFEGCDKLKL